MNKSLKDKLLDKGTGAVVTGAFMLVAFYFGSFATKAEVKETREEILREVQKKVSQAEFVKIKEVAKGNGKQLRNVLRALCIINKKTCDLKDFE